jgi:hypothetical protein
MDISKNSLLFNIGKQLIEQFQLKHNRIFFEFTDNDITSNESIKEFIKNKLNISFEEDLIDIIRKQIPENGINYHIDDCVLITKKTQPTYNKERYIQISENKYLYFNNRFNKIPQKTIIFYMSTYGEDFTGGILRLCDHIEIKPKKYTGIVIDSREVHMVTQIKSGTRNIILVKIY